MRRLKVLFVTSWYPTREQPVRGIFVREHAKAVRLYDNVVVLHLPEPEHLLVPPRQDGSVIASGSGAQTPMRRETSEAISEVASSPNPLLATTGHAGGVIAWRKLPTCATCPLCWLERETDEALAEGIPTWRARYRVSPLPRTSYFVYLWNAFRAFRRIVGSGFRPDVIHAHIYEAGVPAVLLGELHRIPVVISEHYSAFLRKTLTPGELRKARFAFRSARWVLPVSTTLRRGIEGYGMAARFQVVPNVVDVALFAPTAGPREAHDPRRLLFVGTLAPSKGLSYLLQALARLRQQRPAMSWEMDIIGDGPQREVYQRQAAELGLGGSVTFHAARPKPEVAAFMHRADLFVLPSLAETFSVVVAEALTAGLPVLSTECGGPEEIITADSGLLVPLGDADALCAGLICMLEGLQQYPSQAISQYAVDRFSPQVVGRALHAIYESLLKGGSLAESLST